MINKKKKNCLAPPIGHVPSYSLNFPGLFKDNLSKFVIYK